jgi:hypothetical protein
VVSVQFLGVGSQGWDLYQLKHEHDTSQMRVILDSRADFRSAHGGWAVNRDARGNPRTVATLALALGSLNLMAPSPAMANPGTAPTSAVAEEPVTVEGRLHNRDEKPYRNLFKAMKVFDENRKVAPAAIMRFRVLPWRNPSVMQGLEMSLRGNAIRRNIPLADDGSFSLERDPLAVGDDAWVVSNRANKSLAWRADIRTPGLPANTRRLGDLRLECKVDLSGTGADLATGIKPPAFWVVAAVSDPCMNRGVSYPLFADQPIFSVTLVFGSRRETLSCWSVYGCKAPPIFFSMDWHEHLRDRMYLVPIQDTTWPDDTLVELEPLNSPGTDADGGSLR